MQNSEIKMKKICANVFQISELSEAAKQVARQNWIENNNDGDWYSSVYEDAADIADLMGIDIRTRIVKLHGGQYRYDAINIGFSGFSCQGDGAHFQGTYRYAKNAAKAVREYAPLDEELHRIVDALQAVQRTAFYGITASVKHSGHYSHQYCTDIDVSMTEDRYGNDRWPCEDVEDTVTELLRDFMQWIYGELQTAYEHFTSDEAIDERLTEEGCYFAKDGKETIAIH